jgi:hypothetical protein
VAQEEAFRAHVFARTRDLNTGEISALRQAISPDQRETTDALTNGERGAYTWQLLDEIENGQGRAIPGDMISTFPMAQELGIMTPAQPRYSRDQSDIQFLYTSDEEEARDQFLAQVEGANFADAVSLVDQYSRATLLSVLLGTGDPSYSQVLDAVRPVFESAVSEGQDVESIPQQDAFTRTYQDLMAMSHQMVFVDMVSQS